MRDLIINKLEESPIIAAVRGEEDISYAIRSSVSTVFILGGDILNLGEHIKRVLHAGKIVFIHIDLVEGIGKDTAGVKYIARVVKPHGLISTRNHLLKSGSDEGLATIQRMFLVDSSSFQSGIKLIHSSQPDFVEVMPGLVPEAICHLKGEIRQPVIAGGMITCKTDIIKAIQAGALAVSTSKRELWLE